LSLQDVHFRSLFSLIFRKCPLKTLLETLMCSYQLPNRAVWFSDLICSLLS
jgi:hypothetical protein